jgi:hypothetical protein
MLPYGAYIAQVANPHPKTSQKPDRQKISKDMDPRGTTKVSAPKPPPKEPKPEPPPSPPKKPKPEPPLFPLEELDEDIHEETEQL